MIRTVTAAVLVLAAGALVPFAAGAKPEYTATCNANTHDVTLTWPGGTDIKATAALLDWANGSEEAVSLGLPKQGGMHTYTWLNLGSQTGSLSGVEVQFLRNSSFFPSPRDSALLAIGLGSVAFLVPTHRARAPRSAGRGRRLPEHQGSHRSGPASDLNRRWRTPRVV